MAKAKLVNDSEGRFYGVRYDCPCGTCGATILPVSWLPEGATESPHVQGKPHWSFNGDLDKPVFGPSVLSTWHYHDEDTGTTHNNVCHSFIGCNGAQPGQIIFLGDCTHKLAGQTVDLPDLCN
jgi:hypothetical protein